MTTAPRRPPGPLPRPLPPGWAGPGEEYLRWLAAAGQAPMTLRLKRHWLIRVGLSVNVGPWQVTPGDLVRFLGEGRWKPDTRKSARSTIRGFYGWALERGLVDVDPSVGLMPVRIPAGKPKPAPERAVQRALADAGPREQIMLLLGATAGLRIAEIAAVHTRDVEQQPDGPWLRVRGKGSKVRLVPLAGELAERLVALPAGYVFPSPYGDHLGASHVGRLLKRLLGQDLSAHTLRHRFATMAYSESRDLLAVQQLLGHAKPETTARYTQLPGDALRAAARAASFATG